MRIVFGAIVVIGLGACSSTRSDDGAECASILRTISDLREDPDFTSGCSTDADCTLVRPAVSCDGTAGVAYCETAVVAARVSEFDAALKARKERYCAAKCSFDSAPACTSVRARCSEGRCATVDTSVGDAGSD